MLQTLIIAGTLAAATAVLLALLLHRLVASNRYELIDAEWLSGFSVSKYRPMQRLFLEEDYRYLASRKGYDPRLARRLRKERLAVFRGYFKWVKADYVRLEAALRLWMANSPVDRPDLARELLMLRFQFVRAVLTTEVRLFFYGFGLKPTDASRLVGTLDDMRVHLRRLALIRHASLA